MPVLKRRNTGCRRFRLEFPVPQNPDLLIKNTASRSEFLKFSETIANCFKLIEYAFTLTPKKIFCMN